MTNAKQLGVERVVAAPAEVSRWAHRLTATTPAGPPRDIVPAR
ncbi:hypothetical protein [Pseudonocardia oceani]|nr:hypothetical protein [Pseudonocardia oceani]